MRDLAAPVPFAGDADAGWRRLPDDAEYNPLHDRRFLSDVVSAVLLAAGEWCHPGRLVLEDRGGTCDAHLLADATHYAVEQARRLGHVVEGDPVRGYRFVRFEYTTYVRPRDVLCWPPDEFPTQLAIAEAMGGRVG